MPDLEAGLELLKAWGYVPVVGPNLRSQHRYLAGTVKQRAADLVWALTSRDVDAVYVARGGYGCVHCLPAIPWAEVVPGRLLLGFSDVTALLVALGQRTGVTGVHAPTLDKLATKTDAETQAAVQRLLAEGGEVTLPGRLVSGQADAVEGPVVGGNLCVLASLIGTPWQVQADGALLVLEDVDEAPYRLDRMVTQFLESGALARVRAVLLGEFTRCTVPREAGWTLEELLVELVEPLGVPVVCGVGVGHGPHNLPWYFGGRGRLAGGVLQVRPRDVVEAPGARRPAAPSPA
ncbi:peptidase S66 [Chondromyces crocatus]|uniref:Peptidase S66 n=2 Tax=Chondromyces crocatus TaxID=52 RepID=A0A0K1EIR4_CHOCO|nr:peptidase S66 [Chondromyces crocatus]